MGTTQRAGWVVAAAVLATLGAGTARADGTPVPVEVPKGAPASPTVPATPDLAALEAAFKAAPGDVQTGLAYGEALLAAGKRDVALRCFKKNASDRPDDKVADFLAGWAANTPAGTEAMWTALLARLGKPDGNEDGLAKAWDALVDSEQKDGHDDRAVRALERRIALAPDVASEARMGWLKERLGDLPAAEEAYRRALTLDAQDLPARNALALVLARQKKHADAQRLARETVKNYPDSASAYLHLGLVLALAGDKRNAAAAYQQATEHARGDATALAAIGASLAELGQTDLAAQALSASLAQDPANGTALLQSAVLAVEKEDWVEAKRLLALATKALPKNARAAFLQGVCAQRTNQLDAAVNAYRKAVSLDETEPAYALALAAAYGERGAPEQALGALAEAAQHCPQSAEIQLRLGFLQMEKKRWQPALESFRRAAALVPQDPDPHLYMAVLYGDHLDQPAQALLHLEEYQRLGGKAASALAWLKELQDAAKR